MDHRFLRESKPSALAKYFRDALQRYDNGYISNQLLAGVSSESLPPSIACVWVHGFADSTSLLKALRFEDSALVRKSAIRKFGSSIRTSFTDLWDAAGGTPGLLRLFAELSVKDVADLCKAIGRSSTSTSCREERQEQVTELLKALAFDYLPGDGLPNPDSRPLIPFYSRILPTCTPQLAKTWLDHNELQRYVDTYRLCQAHPSDFQQLYMQNIGKKDSKYMYSALLRSIPATAATIHLSGSMRFSLDVLQALHGNKTLDVSTDYILNSVTYPLLRRLERKRSTSQLRAEVIKMALRCVQRHKSGYKALLLSSTSLIGFSIRLWKRRPEKFQHVIDSVSRASTYSRPLILRQIANLLRIVSSRTRYGLLKLLLHQLLSIDLEKDEDLESFRAQWPVDLLLSLPAQHAHVLLERLERLKPSADFLDWELRVFGANSIFQSRDLSTLQVFLSRGEDGQLNKAKETIEKYKTVSMKSREQTDRELWAKAAVFCAIASGSMELYEATLVWCRRYNKDALSLKELYGNSVVQTEEGLGMLCGIPKQLEGITAERIKASIQQGNAILLLLLETACQVLREPHFHLPDWHPVLCLFSVVVRARLERSPALQDVLGLSTDQVFDVLWLDTISMLLNAEQVGLNEAHEKLSFNTLQGPLRHIGHLPTDVLSRIPTCRFIDILAQRRDELWTKLRRSVNPSVTTLPELWTRGLPIQACVPHKSNVWGIGEHAPFLLSLSKRVVFLDPRAALESQPSDEETLEAIGEFVDSYKLALDLYVHSSVENREVRTQKAWDHACDNLSQDGWGRLEITEFWKNVFTDAGVNPPQVNWKSPTRPDLILPHVDDPSEPMSWNPDPEHDRWSATRRKFDVTCLDCLLQRPGEIGADINSAYRPLESKIIHVPEQVPAWEKLVELGSSTLSPQTREALIALAVLFINSKKSIGFRLLAHPFPLLKQARFPAAYLDGDFIERKDLDRNLGESIISKLHQYVPPSLLANLGHGMITPRVKADSVSNFESDMISLIKMLAGSDKPQLAMELIRHVIVERPADSSWHRHLLHKGWLDNLPTKQVKEFLHGLTARIQQKLEEQAKRTTVVGEEPKEPTGPMIKVSTVKMIAQLMSEAQFIGPDFNVDILIGLFENSRHLDIRVSIIESLTSSLQAPSESLLKSRIIDALSIYAVPVAGDVNERSPLTEEAWQKAEGEGCMPEIYQPTPVFEALVRSSQVVSSQIAEQMVHRILLPALNLSIANNRRWMRLFLRTSPDFPLEIERLPAVPVKSSMIRLLMDTHIKYMPASLFDLWTEVCLVNLFPPKPLLSLNESIKASSTARSSSAGIHWLKLWDNKGPGVLYWAGWLMTDHLHTDFTSAVSGGISHQQIQRSAIKLADALISGGEDTLGVQDHFFQTFKVPTRSSHDRWKHWQLNSKPVVEEIISLIENLRTPEWQRDQYRKPTILKDTYEMKLWLLSYSEQENNDRLLDDFAHEVLLEIDGLVSMKGLYHKRLDILKKSVSRRNPSDFCYIACKLGSADQGKLSHPTIAEYLQVEMADSLLREATNPDNVTVVDKATKLLKSWRESPCEDFRMIGLYTTQLLVERGSASWFH